MRQVSRIFKYRFVDFGTRFVPTPERPRTDGVSHPDHLHRNEVAVDVGSVCTIGASAGFVIDHHFRKDSHDQYPSASAAVVHLAGALRAAFCDDGHEDVKSAGDADAETIWLVTHRQPDFDALCSQYLVKSLIEAERAPSGLADAGVARGGWVKAVARDGRKRKIDWFNPDTTRVDPAWRWWVKLASYASLVDNCRWIRCPKERALHSVLYAALYRGRDYLHEDRGASEFFDEVRRRLRHNELDPAFDAVLAADGPFAPELELLDREVEVYAGDVRRARKVIVHVPKADRDFGAKFSQLAETPLLRKADEKLPLDSPHRTLWGSARQPVDGIYLRDPHCLLFKEWARLDTDQSSQQRGFMFTAIAYSGNRDGARIPTDYYFSLDPERASVERLHLYPLWARLQAEELNAIAANRDELESRTDRLPRRDFEGRAGNQPSLWHDPWFDGANYACTLIATPNGGTLIGEPGRDAALSSDDPVARVVREELEHSVYSETLQVVDFQPSLAQGERVPKRERHVPLEEMGQLRDVEDGCLRFAQIALHPDVDTGLGPAGRDIGEFLWRCLHPSAKTLPADFADRHLIVGPDEVSVWSLAGVAVARKVAPRTPEAASGTSLRLTFERIVTLRAASEKLLNPQADEDSETALSRSEEQLAEFGKLQYELALPQFGVLRQFFDAIRLRDVLQGVRDRRATVAERDSTRAIREGTETTAHVQSKVEWLEVLFVSFYAVEFAHVLADTDTHHVPFIAMTGLAFLVAAFIALRPHKVHRSWGLLATVGLLALLLLAAAAAATWVPDRLQRLTGKSQGKAEVEAGPPAAPPVH